MGITVATTSLCVAQDLYNSSIRVLLLGGFLRNEFPSVYGPMTEKHLSDIRVDTLFIGCDGADSRTGFYSNDLHISSLEQAMIGIANQVVVVTESAKFGRRAFARYAAVQDVHIVVTDHLLSKADMEAMEEQKVEVLTITIRRQDSATSSITVLVASSITALKLITGRRSPAVPTPESAGR